MVTALARHLFVFRLAVETLMEEYRANLISNHLHDLAAGHFARLMRAARSSKMRQLSAPNQLMLCDSSARVLSRGLGGLVLKWCDGFSLALVNPATVSSRLRIQLQKELLPILGRRVSSTRPPACRSLSELRPWDV